MSSMHRNSSSSSSCTPVSSSNIWASKARTDGGEPSWTTAAGACGSGGMSVIRWPPASSSPKRRISSSKSDSNCVAKPAWAASVVASVGAGMSGHPAPQESTVPSAPGRPPMSGPKLRGARACAKTFSSICASSSTVCEDASLNRKRGEGGLSLPSADRRPPEAPAFPPAASMPAPLPDISAICSDFPNSVALRPLVGPSFDAPSFSMSLWPRLSEPRQPKVNMPQQWIAATVA
mmetsp:Transcript_41493/g.129526  ORF Transcript_41493/g.129526 Transcript_41493/m.129526 type:complete len:234 (-) Transcript_41493:627-1328(-)